MASCEDLCALHIVHLVHIVHIVFLCLNHLHGLVLGACLLLLLAVAHVINK